MNILSNLSSDILYPGTIVNGKWNGNTYLIRRMLGSGANGVVYLVESSGKQYALKTSLATIDLSYEIQAILRLNETQGPKLGFSLYDIDDFQYNNRLYSFYVMPYHTGITIEQYLYGKKDADYLYVFKIVLDTLALIHQEGFAFGDLKPEHILIDPYTKEVSLIDFGGVTSFGEGVRQYTEAYDRGSWKKGNRKADLHYDLFTIAMVFIQLGVGKNKFSKIYNHTRSIDKVCDIIPNITSLNLLAPLLKKIFNKTLTISEVMNDLQKIPIPSNIQNNKRSWIDWLFTFSFILFILVVINIIFFWSIDK